MIKYQILSKNQLIVICAWGGNTLEDILIFSKKLREDPDFSQGYDTIFYDNQTESKLTNDDIRILSEPRIDTSKEAGKIAIVAPKDIVFGLSRMHEILSESKMPNNICVFREIESALKWLGQEILYIEKIVENLMMK